AILAYSVFSQKVGEMTPLYSVNVTPLVGNTSKRAINAEISAFIARFFFFRMVIQQVHHRRPDKLLHSCTTCQSCRTLPALPSARLARRLGHFPVKDCLALLAPLLPGFQPCGPLVRPFHSYKRLV